jgi:hypothetical protein
MEDFISLISMRKTKEAICSKESVLFYHTQIMKNYQCKIYDSFFFDAVYDSVLVACLLITFQFILSNIYLSTSSVGVRPVAH